MTRRVTPFANASGIMSPMDAAALRSRLAQLGVGLFEPAAPRAAAAPDAESYAHLVAALAASGDPRLRASLPCLFALHDEGAASAATDAASRLAPDARERLGLAWRIARALVVSRAPDLRHLFGRDRRLPPLPFEPDDLPDPGDDHGERCLWMAHRRHEDDPAGDPVGDLEDLFDAWLRLAECERGAAPRA